MTEQPQKFPNSVIIFIALLTGIIVFLATRYHYDKRPDLKRATEKRAEAQANIDTLQASKTNDIKTAVKHSNQQASHAGSLLKNIKNEKIIVPDAAYDSMCSYITNYRYVPVAIEADTRQP